MATVKARVKKHNNYGGAPAGMIIDVDEEELKRAPWCLELYEEAAAASQAMKIAKAAEYASDAPKAAAPLVEHMAAVENEKPAQKRRK